MVYFCETICYTPIRWIVLSTTSTREVSMKMTKNILGRRLMALTLAALLLLSQSMALAAYQTLEYGSRGSSVLELQKALLALGFNPNGTDGKYGSGTREAVKAYQKSRGLSVDGKAGNITLTLLYSEIDGSVSAGDPSAGTETPTSADTLK